MLSPAESGMCGKASTCRSEGLIVGYDVLASSAIGNGGDADRICNVEAAVRLGECADPSCAVGSLVLCFGVSS